MSGLPQRTSGLKDFARDADHAGEFSDSLRIITGIGIKHKEVGNLLELTGNRQ